VSGLDLILPQVDASPEWIAGQYYDLTNKWPASSLGGQAAVADTIYTSPLWVPRTAPIDRLAINVTSAAAAGNKARLGILSKAAGSPLPGALLIDGGEVAIDALGAVAATVSLVLPGPALYHVAFHPQANCSITGYAPSSSCSITSCSLAPVTLNSKRKVGTTYENQHAHPRP